MAGFFSRIFRRKHASGGIAPNESAQRGFFSQDSGRYFEGWDSQSYSIDFYLQTELKKIRARSRRMVRMNPLGKRYINIMKNNVVGPEGVLVQAQSVRFRGGREELDTAANDAIENAFWDWCLHHCDVKERLSFIDMQNLAVSNSAQDGEFLFRKHYGKGFGKYGFQLQAIDPELLDTEKNELTTNGGEIRLGVEYNQNGKVVRYHFKQRNFNGDYNTGRTYTVDAKYIIHGFVHEWPDQSRGIPWMHAGLETAKHLEKYNEAAIVASRAKAGAMAFIKSKAGDEFTGGEDGSSYGAGTTLEQFDPGTIKDIGDREIQTMDLNYPHQMYEAFLKGQQRDIASGWGVAYHALSNNLESVNYSSIRAGVLEDREAFKGIQNWMIRALIKPVYEEWLLMAYTMGSIKIGQIPLSRPIDQYMPHSYQPRRWPWVDPQKDGAANELAIKLNLKSRSQIIREQGDDPEAVFREIQREREALTGMGIPLETENEQANRPEAPEE